MRDEMTGKNKNTYLKFFFLFLILTLIGVRDIANLSFPNFLIVGIVSLPLILLPYNLATPFLFFILPFTCGIPGYAVLLSYIIILAKAKQYNIWQFLPPLVFGVLELTHITFSNIDVSLVTTISFLSFIALFFFLLFDSDDRVDKIACIRMFIYGTITVLFIIYAGIIINNSFEDLITGALRSGAGMGIEDGEEAKLNGHLAMNANSIAHYSITVFSLLLLGHKWLKMPVFLYGCLLALSILSGVFTFSRTWMLVAVLVLSIYLITTKHKILSFTIVIATVSIVLTFYASTIDGLSDVFLGRFDEMETAGGRTTIFAAYNEFWLSKISYVLFGAGAMCYKHIIDFEHSMHNGLQQIYVSYGIVGILLFAFVIRQFYKKHVTRNLSIIFYLPFFACIIFDQSIQFWDPYYLIFPFVATAYVLAVCPENQGNINFYKR